MPNRIINRHNTRSFVLMIGLNNCNVYASSAFFVAAIQTSINTVNLTLKPVIESTLYRIKILFEQIVFHSGIGLDLTIWIMT